MFSKEICKRLKNHLDFIILTEIATGPKHGYGLIKYIREKSGAYFGPSTVYPLLDSFEKKGYIKSSWSTWNSESGRPRKLYSLTGNGRKYLKERLPCVESTLKNLEHYLKELKSKIDTPGLTIGVELPEIYAEAKNRN
jgi:DNA-binding PadR family transcriptional regulator